MMKRLTDFLVWIGLRKSDEQRRKDAEIEQKFFDELDELFKHNGGDGYEEDSRG